MMWDETRDGTWTLPADRVKALSRARILPLSAMAREIIDSGLLPSSARFRFTSPHNSTQSRSSETIKCAARFPCRDAVQVALVASAANGSVISTLRAG